MAAFKSEWKFKFWNFQFHNLEFTFAPKPKRMEKNFAFVRRCSSRWFQVLMAMAVVLSSGVALAQDVTKMPVESSPNPAEALSLVSGHKTSITEMAAKMDYEDVCELNQSAASASGISSTNVILFVGTVSSLVFSFIGIFPAFFIHTDDQEKVFSKLTASWRFQSELLDRIRDPLLFL